MVTFVPVRFRLAVLGNFKDVYLEDLSSFWRIHGRKKALDPYEG